MKRETIGQKHTEQLVSVSQIGDGIYRLMMGTDIFNISKKDAPNFFTFFGTTAFDKVHSIIGDRKSKFDDTHIQWKTIKGTEFTGSNFKAAIVPGTEHQGMLKIVSTGPSGQSFRREFRFRYANDKQRNFAVLAYKTYF